MANGLNDNYDDDSSLIHASIFSLLYPQMGKSVIAHEMGHLLSSHIAKGHLILIRSANSSLI